MLNEQFTPLPPAANKSFSPKLAWPNNSRIRLWFKGSRLKQEDKATFTPNNVVNLFIFYELNRWSRDLNAESSLKYCLLGNFRITKDADPVKYSYSGCRIGYDFPSLVSTPNCDWSKNISIFGIGMSSSMHIDNKNKDILIVVKGPTQRLDHVTLTVEVRSSIYFSRSQRTFCLSIHYTGINRFLFVNAIKIISIQSKTLKENDIHYV